MKKSVVLMGLVLSAAGCASKGALQDVVFNASRPAAVPSSAALIEVTEGDNLWVMAEALWGDPTYWYSLAVMNDLRAPWIVRVGQKLKVPAQSALVRALRGKAQSQEETQALKIRLTQKDEAQRFGWVKDKNRAFAVGERLKFAVQYGPITGGYATLEIPEYTLVSGRPTFHIQAVARTHPSFEWLIKVRDVVDSYVDVDYLFSWKYSKHLREGSYRQDSDYIYDQRAAHEVIDDNNLRTKIAPETHDVLSCFYYFRTLDLNPGDVIKIPVAADDMKFYELIVKVIRREKNVETLAGRFDTIVVVPELKFEGVFQQKGKVTIWLTDDERHIPVKIKSKIAIGSININLQEATWVRPPEEK